jgi:tellurite resistance protein
MELLGMDPAEAIMGLRAMRTLAAADGRFHDSEEALIRAAAAAYGQRPERSYPGVTPEELADQLTDPQARERVLQAMILMTLMDGQVSDDEIACVDHFARVLGVHEPRVRNLRQLAHGHIALMWCDLARRSFARDVFIKRLQEEGFGGVWKIVGPMIGMARDPALAQRYHALADLPAGTLGRAYWEFVIANDLGFPGEPRAVPEAGMWHDMTHVLAGYGTEPEEEVQVVAFIAGYRREDPFFWLFTIALQFHLGIKVSPYSPASEGLFEPTRVMHALRRGAAMNRDISQGWDHRPHLARPLDDVRRELGIPPRAL